MRKFLLAVTIVSLAVCLSFSKNDSVVLEANASSSSSNKTELPLQKPDLPKQLPQTANQSSQQTVEQSPQQTADQGPEQTAKQYPQQTASQKIQQQTAYQGPQQSYQTISISAPSFDTFEDYSYGSYNSYGKNSYGPSRPQQTITLLNGQIDSRKHVAGIIVSFYAGSTYDDIFRRQEQKAEEGTQVLVYSANSDNIIKIYKAFQDVQANTTKEGSDKTLNGMIAEILKLDKECPSCVVFNWQCSSGYGDDSVAEGQRVMDGLLKLILDRGYLTMFSDFSLKALIGHWQESTLGPNPFKKLGTTSQSIDLRFDNEVLKKSPSAQLQIVGKLADKGHVNVHVLSGTIVYGVDAQRQKTDKYTLEVLTVAVNQRTETRYASSIGQNTGTAGHVLLRYPSGGIILTSMGHWVELLSIDTSATSLFRVVEQKYGSEYVQNLQSQYGSLPAAEQQAFVNSYAAKQVQANSPGSYKKGF